MAVQVMRKMRTLGKMGVYGEGREKGLLGIDGKIYPPSGIMVPDPDGPGGMVAGPSGVHDGIDMRYVKDEDLPPNLRKLRAEDPEHYSYIGPKPGSISALREAEKNRPRGGDYLNPKGLDLPKDPLPKRGSDILFDPVKPLDDAGNILMDPVAPKGFQIDFTSADLAHAASARSLDEINRINDFSNFSREADEVLGAPFRDDIAKSFDDACEIEDEDEREMEL